MKALVCLVCGITLSGCSVNNDNTCSTEHETTEPYTDQYGLTLEPSSNMHIMPEQISLVYEHTMACMGLTAEGPTIYFKSFTEYFGGVIGGWGFHTGGFVYINTDNPLPNAQRDCNTDKQVLDHEFVHHILNANGMDEENRGHNSPLFAQCGLGVAVNH